MKRPTPSLLVVVAMVCVFTSCDKTAQKSGASDEPSAMSDSVAMVQGYMTGQQLAQQFMMTAMQGMPVDSMEFLKGLKKGITDITKFSYYAGQIQGVQTAMSLVKEDIDVKLLTEYLDAAFKGDTTKLDMDQGAAYTYVQNYYQKKQEIENKEKFGKNIEAGKKTIVELSKQEGVITTKSGIAYRYASKGTGKSPIDDDKVRVIHCGTFIDGIEFDKSEEPVEPSINQVIPGWTELLKLMKVGDQITTYIPYGLAYGANDSGPFTEPFSTLIFDIKFLEAVLAEKK